jgi:hypothetical protein
MDKEKEILLPSKTIILDWYDGILTAVVQFSDKENWHLVSLRAWDLNKREKVYSLNELTVEDNRKILSLFKDQKRTWPIWIVQKMQFDNSQELERLLERIRKSFTDEYVFLTGDLSNGIFNLQKIPTKYSPADIDSIMNLSREEMEYWYGLFNGKTLTAG